MVTPANTPDRLLINHASSELRTLRDWLRFTVSYFNQADLFFWAWLCYGL